MIQLLIADAAPTEASDNAFGGLPVAPAAANFVWPTCKSCKGAMQFLGQLRIPEESKLVLLFMCQNDPGMCDEWDANMGGTAALVVSSEGVAEVPAPKTGETVRGTRYGARQVASAAEDYDAARDAWDSGAGEILGQVRGAPAWIQGDETPECNACGQPMNFLAQLEEGPEPAMNFGGGGCAYVFDCACGDHSAKLLWQS